MFDAVAIIGGAVANVNYLQDMEYQRQMAQLYGQSAMQGSGMQNALGNVLGNAMIGGASHCSSVSSVRAVNAVNPTPKVEQKEKSMFKEVVSDVKGFVLEHRGIIYFIIAALMVDHFFFKGAFKARLQAMADKVVTKVEEKIK